MTTVVISDYYRDLALQEVLAENRPRLLNTIEQIAAVTKNMSLIRTPDGLREIKIKEMDDERSR